MSDTKRKEAELFTDRRKFLLASATRDGNKYSAWFYDRTVYGIASTEHRFLLAVALQEIALKKLNRDDMEALMREELAAPQEQAT